MFTVFNSIVCDRVATDAKGKYICEGIYPRGVIFVRDFEHPIYVSFYIEIMTNHIGDVSMQFQIENRLIGRVYHNLNAVIDLNGNASSPLYGGPYAIEATGPGVIAFSAIAGGQRIDLAWVHLNQSYDPTALQRPS